MSFHVDPSRSTNNWRDAKFGNKALYAALKEGARLERRDRVIQQLQDSGGHVNSKPRSILDGASTGLTYAGMGVAIIGVVAGPAAIGAGIIMTAVGVGINAASAYSDVRKSPDMTTKDKLSFVANRAFSGIRASTPFRSLWSAMRAVAYGARSFIPGQQKAIYREASKQYWNNAKSRLAVGLHELPIKQQDLNRAMRQEPLIDKGQLRGWALDPRGESLPTALREYESAVNKWLQDYKEGMPHHVPDAGTGRAGRLAADAQFLDDMLNELEAKQPEERSITASGTMQGWNRIRGQLLELQLGLKAELSGEGEPEFEGKEKVAENLQRLQQLLGNASP